VPEFLVSIVRSPEILHAGAASFTPRTARLLQLISGSTGEHEKLVKQILMSATYRVCCHQQGKTKADNDNVLVSYAPRVRSTRNWFRDLVLESSGY
jgi:hypothetical protein